MKYDESDNIVIRASRVVTDKLTDVFSMFLKFPFLCLSIMKSVVFIVSCIALYSFVSFYAQLKVVPGKCWGGGQLFQGPTVMKTRTFSRITPFKFARKRRVKHENADSADSA